MDFKRLRNFQEVAVSGSLSRASDRLRIAQPALSRQMTHLEHELGQSLFTRHGRGMHLTEAGAAFLARIEEPLRQLEQAAADIRAQPGVVSGRVALGMMPTIAASLGGDIAQQMFELYPNIAFRIDEGYAGHLIDWLRRGIVDVTFLYGPAPDQDLRVQPLFVEELRLIGRADRLTVRSISLDEIARQPLILPSGRHGLRKVVEAAFQLAHVALPVCLEIDSYSLLKDLIRRGIGYAILPRSGASILETEADLISARLSPALSRQVILALRPSTELDRAMRMALGLLESIVSLRAAAGYWTYIGSNVDRDCRVASGDPGDAARASGARYGSDVISIGRRLDRSQQRH